jgi:hypothetical protein
MHQPTLAEPRRPAGEDAPAAEATLDASEHVEG